MSGSLLTPEQRSQLVETANQPDDSLLNRWARVLVLYDDGLLTHQVASQVGLSRSRTRYIKQKFLEHGWDDMTGSQVASTSLPELTPDEPEIDAEPIPTTADAQPEVAPQKAKKVKELVGKSNPPGEHSADLALQLLDGLQPIFKSSLRERAILQAAARLHRLGSRPKTSSQAVLVQPLAGFSPQEQQLVADLVRNQQESKHAPRFHNLPDGADAEWRALALLAVLRMALALDSSDTQTVVINHQAVDRNGMLLQISSVASLADATGAQSAAAFWSKVFGHQVHVYTNAPIDLEDIRSTASTLTGPGLHPDDAMPEAGRKILRYHFLQMLLHEPGTRLGEDIEELHDMRVATRRMRAAFEVFGEYFEGKKVKSIRKGLRNTGRALGAVRDLDVIFEKAEHYLINLDETQRSGISPLIELWQAELQTAREAMLAYLDSQAYQNFVYETNEFVNSPGLGAVAFQMDNPQPYRVREVAPIMIYSRLGAVRAFDQVISNATFEQLHELRIRYKYLRYTVEFFREVLGVESKTVIEHIKGVQDHLGDLNDANVACQMLQGFLEDWESRQQSMPLGARQNPEPVVQYLAYRTAERHQLLIRFPEVWKNFNDPELLAAVAASLGVL